MLFVHKQHFIVKVENMVPMCKSFPPTSVFPIFFEREADSFTPDAGCRTCGNLLVYWE